MRVKPTERAPDLYNRPATMKYNRESGRWEARYDEDGAPAGEILLLKYWGGILGHSCWLQEGGIEIVLAGGAWIFALCRGRK